MSADNNVTLTTAVPRNSVDELACSNTVPDVLAFMQYAQPLDGCDYSDDERFEHGRQLILEWLEGSHDYPAEARDIPASELLHECADVLYFIHSLESLRNVCTDEERIGRVECGYMEVLMWIEKQIARIANMGSERGHKTAAEKQREEARGALEEPPQGAPLN